MKKKSASTKENSSVNKRNLSRRNFLKLSAAGAEMTISGTCGFHSGLNYSTPKVSVVSTRYFQCHSKE